MTDHSTRGKRQPSAVVDGPTRLPKPEPDLFDGSLDWTFVVGSPDDAGLLARCTEIGFNTDFWPGPNVKRASRGRQIIVVVPAQGPDRERALKTADDLRPVAAKLVEWTIADLGSDETPDLRSFGAKYSLPKTLAFEQPWRNPVVASGPILHGDGKHRTPSAEIGDDVLEDVSDPVEDVDPAAFHGVLGKLALLTQPETEANPLFVQLHLLTFFGAAIGRTAYFVTSATHHYMTLYIGLVGPTGTGRKGTAADVAREIWRKIDPAFTDTKIRGGLNSGAGLLYHLRDPSEKRGKKGKPESDEGVDDKRHVFLESELSSALMHGHREHEPILCQLRDFFDCRPVVGSYTRDPTTVTGGHIGIMGHCTPPDLTLHLNDLDKKNGTANRFMWHHGVKSKSLPEGGNVFGLLDNFLSAELDGLKDAVEFARGVGEIRRRLPSRLAGNRSIMTSKTRHPARSGHSSHVPPSSS